jgi:hypothetical protein
MPAHVIHGEALLGPRNKHVMIYIHEGQSRTLNRIAL